MEINSPKEFIQQMREMLKFMEKIHNQEYKVPVNPETKTAQLKDFTELRLLLKTTIWPKAVEDNQLLIKEDTLEKTEKAILTLISLVKSEFENQKILDLGCGDGFCSFVAVSNLYAKKSVGYDKENNGWEKLQNENVVLTTDWDVVKSNGPYDIIFANDVLDHSEDFDVILEKTKDLRTENTRTFIRCHPWCSRHGAHLHTQINKAFVHIVFSDEELQIMGYKPKFTHRLLDPLTSYRKLFQKIGFTILAEEVTKTPVEPMFHTNEKILRRIKEKWQTMTGYSDDRRFPREYLEIEAVDFTLI